jgi:hypothetical protein
VRLVVALVMLAACGHRETAPVHVTNTVREVPTDANPDAEPIDPRFVQCESYGDTVRRAVACTSLAKQLRDQIQHTYDELGPSITERYMDGGDGFTVNAQCDAERAKIEALAKAPCGW